MSKYIETREKSGVVIGSNTVQIGMHEGER